MSKFKDQDRKSFEDLNIDAAEELDFLATIQKLERVSTRGKRLSSEMMPLAEALNADHVQAVPILNWLGNVEIVRHPKGDKVYLQLVPPANEANIVEHFINWLGNTRAGYHAMKAYHCHGIFVKRPRGGAAYAYPEDNIKRMPDAARAIDHIVQGVGIARQEALEL